MLLTRHDNYWLLRIKEQMQKLINSLDKTLNVVKIIHKLKGIYFKSV